VRDDPRNPRVSIRRERAHKFGKPSPRPYHQPAQQPVERPARGAPAKAPAPRGARDWSNQPLKRKAAKKKPG
jgi:hypothetical protein